MTSKITSKGQITLPRKISTALVLHPGNRVEFIMDKKGRVHMIPVKTSIKEIKGMVPAPAKPVSLKEMHKAIEEGAGRL
jgi:antitoxin PrlF